MPLEAKRFRHVAVAIPELRVNEAIERPTAVLTISNLPTTATAATGAKTTSRSK